MRIALFGGSFDPVHRGHIELIRSALSSGSADIVIVIPAVNNSFKRGRALIPAPYRYYMVSDVIRCEFDKDVFVCDIEFNFEGITYTVNTLKEITKDDYITPYLKKCGFSDKAASKRHSFFWLCGSDILPTFDKWYKPAEILSYVTLLCASRLGEDSDIYEQSARLKSIYGCDIAVFEMKGVDQSSSGIKKERDFDSLPEKAQEFINTHDIYNAVSVLDKCSDKACELYYEAAVKMYHMLSGKRLLHTLNVGLLSASLAADHGADPDKALIAGCLHDCAKELPIDVQLSMAKAVCGDLFTDEKLLHSPAGAFVARERFGITDSEVLDAITYHTTGRGNATLLDKIVYLADKIEPSRTYTDLTEMRRLAPTDLNASLRLCALSVADKFKKKKRPLHPVTSDFMLELGISQIML
ncbi:MAG: bis(5'-nucleosyl)-tetraphosphatase (symmetrical) YqeK [Clostridiales bacterium]|nr:bis(5'-nucleosyl)-tetraphosphatase (symmetrical) YqeK [Clostridiales bacterium]